MTPGAWISVATICVLGAMSPGPSLAVVARHALSGSRAQGIACALAHAVGVGLYALLTVLGLSALMLSRPVLYDALTLAGAVYLLWLGVGALRTDPGGAPAEARARVPADLFGAVRDGFTIALVNPKIAVFFLAVFSQFVDPGAGGRDTAILGLTAMTIDGAWYAIVATWLSGRRADRLRRRRPLIARVTGVVLIGLGSWTLWHFAPWWP